MATLEEFYAKLLGTNDEELIARCVAATEIQDFPRGETMAEIGAPVTRLMFILSGVSRAVALGEKGREVTQCLAWRPGDYLLPDADLYSPISARVEAVTNCRVVAIPMTAYEELRTAYPQVMEAYTRYVTAYCDEHIKLHTALAKYNAKKRYEWFIKEYAEILDLVPDKYIASSTALTHFYPRIPHGMRLPQNAAAARRPYFYPRIPHGMRLFTMVRVAVVSVFLSTHPSRDATL